MSSSTNISWPGWETGRLIGRGSFGAVYEIKRDVFGDTEKAALKVISIPQNDGDIEEMYSDGYDDESITSTFQSHLKSIVAEYSLMRKMNGCANIVSCDDVRYVQHEDSIGWDIFIKMELLTPLTKALPADISEETVRKIAKDMCAALEVCKKFDIVHRDIKPQNIFVSDLGDYKLGDFGIAKTVEKTMGGTKIGTYKYMAPEVYNNQPYGSSADIYSLGLVLYWLLNERRMPFLPLPPAKLGAGLEEKARIRRFSGEALPEPAHGSRELKKIVLKACAFDPKERYASAADMLADLRALDGGSSPVVAAPISTPKAEPAPVPVAMPAEPAPMAAEDKTVNVFATVATPAEEKTVVVAAEEEKTAFVGPVVPPAPPAPATPVKPAPAPQPAETFKPTAVTEAEHTRTEKKKRPWIIPVACVAIAVVIIILLCSFCGQNQSQGGKNECSEHKPVSGGCDTATICGVCGKQLAEPKGHRWVRLEENPFEVAIIQCMEFPYEAGSDASAKVALDEATRILRELHRTVVTEDFFKDLAAQNADNASYHEYGIHRAWGEPNLIHWCFEKERVASDLAIIDQGNKYVLVRYIRPASYMVMCDDPEYCTVCHGVSGDISEVLSVKSIVINTGPNKTNYTVGDVLSTEGLSIKVLYSDGTSKILTDGFECNPISLNSEGTQTITITYGGKSTTFTVTVEAVKLASISVERVPDKSLYYVGSTLRTDGLQLKLQYNDGTISYADSGFTCSPVELNTVNSQKITVTYGGQSTSFYVEVVTLLDYGDAVRTIASGQCGPNAIWKLTQDNELLILGQSVMYDYEESPWHIYRAQIKAIAILNGMESIGDNAFAWCSSVPKVTIPDSVISIGEYAFYECKMLANVDLSSSITSIGNFAFNGTALEMVTLPDSLMSIGEGAFSKTKLTDISIPRYVTQIGQTAFTQIPSLTSINVVATNTTYCSVDGVLFNKSKTELITFPAAKASSYTIPNTVTRIGDFAFWFSGELETVVIPNSVTEIGYYAFEYCTSLKDISIPSSVKSIGNGAFLFCSNLKKVVINNRECDIYDVGTTLGVVGTTVIYGYAGSTAQTYAEKFGYTFVAI